MSSIHKLTDDEMWFFLQGGKAEQLVIFPDGREELRILDSTNRASLVKGKCYQGTKLVDGDYALFSTIMSPKYNDDMYSSADELLFTHHPIAKEFLN